MLSPPYLVNKQKQKKKKIQSTDENYDLPDFYRPTNTPIIYKSNNYLYVYVFELVDTLCTHHSTTQASILSVSASHCSHIQLVFFFSFLFLLDLPRYGRRFRERMFFKRSKPLLVELYSISSTPFLALFFFSPPLPPSPPRTHFSPRRARGHSTNCIQCIKKTRTTFQVTTMMISPLRSYSRVFLSYPHPDVRYSDIGYNFLASMLFRPKF